MVILSIITEFRLINWALKMEDIFRHFIGVCFVVHMMWAVGGGHIEDSEETFTALAKTCIGESRAAAL